LPNIHEQGYPLFRKFKHLRYDIRDAILGFLASPRGVLMILIAAKHYPDNERVQAETLSSLVTVQQGIVTMRYGDPRQVDFYTSIVDTEAIPTLFLALANLNTDYDVVIAGLMLLDAIGNHSRSVIINTTIVLLISRVAQHRRDCPCHSTRTS
jgi:hypothetical protein